MSRGVVAFSIVGTNLDGGIGGSRWKRWRPTVSLCQQAALPVDRLVLLREPKSAVLADIVAGDVKLVSPGTEVEDVVVSWKNAWDFEDVYSALHDVARAYTFRQEREDYLVHITTGTHVAQICLFLLTESRYFPARLVQSSPPANDGAPTGSVSILDLDLSKYDGIASRFRRDAREGQSFLKAGIPTRNAAFNGLIERIEQVALASRAPLLLTGPTGAGKSQLAARLFELKKARRQITGDFVPVNCATLRGDAAMSTLFGHARGAFTGAIAERAGLLRRANGGMLFLDEIGELGLDEQAMLLRALEQKAFYPMGSDRELHSDFVLVAGTNHDLRARAAKGLFRDDLLARIDLWTFALPALRDRPEDIEPNLAYELELASRSVGTKVTMNDPARRAYLSFATSPRAAWAGNFRDLNASVTRMATLAVGGRITRDVVDEEIARLERSWSTPFAAATHDPVAEVLGPARAAAIDRFDRAQLAEVIRACRAARSLSEAGRSLFAVSRKQRTTINDADRLRKYLARFDLDWSTVAGRE